MDVQLLLYRQDSVAFLPAVHVHLAKHSLQLNLACFLAACNGLPLSSIPWCSGCVPTVPYIEADRRLPTFETSRESSRQALLRQLNLRQLGLHSKSLVLNGLPDAVLLPSGLHDTGLRLSSLR